jgi:hypothetical protein
MVCDIRYFWLSAAKPPDFGAGRLSPILSGPETPASMELAVLSSVTQVL